jgi:dipeptidyl aminopeptidase/acylaminoacyl peptidase
MRVGRYGTLALLVSLPVAAGTAQQNAALPAFTADQILAFPSPDNLIASPSRATIAWTFNERGVRNIFVGAAPDYRPRQITGYEDDDGQEITQLAYTRDAGTIIYVRGGDHGSNSAVDSPNPAGSTTQPHVQIWSIRVAGGEPVVIGNGDNPVIAPQTDEIAFIKNHQMWFTTADGSRKEQPGFYDRGAVESPSWSPDGQVLAYVSNRGDHSFIGLFATEQAIHYMSPSTSRDSHPVWSADGKKVAFVRQPGLGGAPRPPLVEPPPQPWSIMIADVSKRDQLDGVRVTTAITSGTPVDPILQNPGGIQLRWAADDTIVFLAYRDGYPHLYSIQHPGAGGKPLLLTPGSFMVEQFTLTPDRRFIVYTANTGADREDLDRRHLFKVPINAATPTPLTSGKSIEWSPIVTSDNRTVAFLRSDAQRPPAPAIVPLAGGPTTTTVPTSPQYPSARFVTPTLVSFKASDGVEAHGQLFVPQGGGQTKKPAIVYIHGGGPRQMLLGWHYRWEYANDYGANQLLASRGFIVLSVDYRLSVGYGQAYQFAEGTATRGASEYRDILAAGKYLQSRSDVDPARIGVWGASFGGYLTALALGRNSDVFAAGVDIHGIHDRLSGVNPFQQVRATAGDAVSEADLNQAIKVAFESSPVAAVPTWKSPVLLVHGDDDHAVDFHQTVDLEQRLIAKGVSVESIVLPDDVHDSLLWRNWVTTITAMVRFFEQHLERVRN